MDTKTLEEQVANLFADLKDLDRKTQFITETDEKVDAVTSQLEKLFSDVPEAALTSPSDPVVRADPPGLPPPAPTTGAKPPDPPPSVLVVEGQAADPPSVPVVETKSPDPPPPVPPVRTKPPDPPPPLREQRHKPPPSHSLSPPERATDLVITGDPLQVLEERLLRLLTSKSVNSRCMVVEHLARVQSEGAVDPLLQAAADPHPRVAGLAIAALLQINELVNRRLLTLVGQKLPSLLHRGSEAYFSHLLSQPFVYIPAGPFLMGSHPDADPLADENEQPPHTLRLAGYWIGRYPVTTSQFKAFITKTGYRPGGDKYRDQPGDHPAVDTTWPDALAYCGWLNERSGLGVVTMPSEAEWEKAARGVDSRRYPWGNEPPTEDLCSFNESTPVGYYSPQGDSPFGCADMAGNVWEWTRSIYQPYPYDPQDGRERLDGDHLRVIRGLTLNNVERFTRCAFRYKLTPSLHMNHLGFRAAISPSENMTADR